jgi:ribosomal protein L11 methylase PrmA
MIQPPAYADPASFRDPAGNVYRVGDRIYRAVSAAGTKSFEAVWQSGILHEMAEQKRIISSEKIDSADANHLNIQAEHLLLHPTLPCITYPYEWSFSALKCAALAHLDFHLELLERGFTLSDASAFNMQLDGSHPLHIDVLSVIPYVEGESWGGYRQFLQQFLNPLVFESRTGVSFAPFFRATLDGVSSQDLFRLLPWYRWVRPGLLLHVAMPAWGERYYHMQKQSKNGSTPAKLPKNRYRNLLQHLRQIIDGLSSPHTRHSAWAGYTNTTSYSESEATVKKQVVGDFVKSHQPQLLLDVGCNKGDFSLHALESGAARVVGVDADRAAVDVAFGLSHAKNLSFTPLVLDLTNPSPSQGWDSYERTGFTHRIKADAIIVLALIHHLCIGKNIPLQKVVDFLVSLAPCGIIEFIPKSDPQIIELLRYRKDIFPDYSLENFRNFLLTHAHIRNETTISESGRILFEFARK